MKKCEGIKPGQVFMKALEEMVHRRDNPRTDTSLHFMGYYYYSYYLCYALGLPTFIVIIIALYLLFTGANPIPKCPPFLTQRDHKVIQLLTCTLVCCAQALERRSTSAGSSKRQVHTCGRRRASVSV